MAYNGCFLSHVDFLLAGWGSSPASASCWWPSALLGLCGLHLTNLCLRGHSPFSSSCVISPVSYENTHHVDLGPTWVIQNDLISRFLSIFATNLFWNKVTFPGSEPEEMDKSFGAHNSMHHRCQKRELWGLISLVFKNTLKKNFHVTCIAWAWICGWHLEAKLQNVF